MATVMVTPDVNLALSLFSKNYFCDKIETQVSALTPGTVRFCMALFSIVFSLLMCYTTCVPNMKKAGLASRNI